MLIPLMRNIETLFILWGVQSTSQLKSSIQPESGQSSGFSESTMAERHAGISDHQCFRISLTIWLSSMNISSAWQVLSGREVDYSHSLLPSPPQLLFQRLKGIKCLRNDARRMVSSSAGVHGNFLLFIHIISHSQCSLATQLSFSSNQSWICCTDTYKLRVQ